MERAPKILAFAGSTRQESFNKKLIRVAAEMAQKAGAQVTLLDLKDYPMPLVDQDLESKEGLPVHAKKIKQLMIEHDALLISSPEYNSSITPLLKNTLDWASRAEGSEKGSVAYQGKVAAVLSASPGALGGLRSLLMVRSLLDHLGVLVIPQKYALSKAGEAFDPSGKIVDKKQLEAVEKVVLELVQAVKRFKKTDGVENS